MLECKICGTNLYKNITFSNMFKMKYEVHKECLDKLVINKEEEVIPIDSNIIIYDYVFKKYPNSFNEQYLEFHNLMSILIKHIENKEWSIMLFYDDLFEQFIMNNNPYLLINLTNEPILIVSLVERNISILEHL